MLQGYVCLIGAGPGDPGLITLKGLEYLRRADILLYDHLISGSLLLEVPETCERIDVGKRGGQPSAVQSWINDLLISHARAGKFVVRLKGGDPFLLGRGGEEAMALVEAGVPYLMVPGISSSLAVPAYAGVPVTDRRFCSGVEITTGFSTRNASMPHTKVILMALNHLQDIVSDLLTQGYAANTPACLISQGTTALQKVVSGELAQLDSLIQTHPISTPALLVVGDVVRLGKKLDWRYRLLLAGKRILWTRPFGRDASSLDELSVAGAEVIKLPMVEIRDVSEEERREKVVRAREYDYLVFTSATAVEVFFDTLLKMKEDWRYLGQAEIVVIGKKTGLALWMKGRKPDVTATASNSRALLDTLLPMVKKTERIALYRAHQTLPDLAEGLSGAGISFDDFTLYDLVCPSYSAELIQKILEYPFEVVVLTSPLGVANFFRVMAESGIIMDSQTRFACLGLRTVNELQKYNLESWLTIQKPDIDELIKQLLLRLANHEKTL
ncbi:MAG TPA: uroporphyrinogen-III C-methyltransferase [Firmicutes bacterium]|jgi:uroporphyrinogen III methyltransferase / synthase|nr:uroporphyrinogen-III C-methyltransferase [Bacillota bacterium]